MRKMARKLVSILLTLVMLASLCGMAPQDAAQQDSAPEEPLAAAAPEDVTEDEAALPMLQAAEEPLTLDGDPATYTVTLIAYDKTNGTEQAGGEVAFSDSGKGTTISGDYEGNSSRTVGVYPASDYTFTGWAKGSPSGEIVSTSSPYTFTVTEDVTLYAMFEKDVPATYTITVNGGKAYKAGGVEITGAAAGDFVYILFDDDAAPAGKYIEWGSAVTEPAVSISAGMISGTEYQAGFIMPAANITVSPDYLDQKSLTVDLTGGTSTDTSAASNAVWSLYRAEDLGLITADISDSHQEKFDLDKDGSWDVTYSTNDSEFSVQDSCSVTGDKTLTIPAAEYSPVTFKFPTPVTTYTVTFDANGGNEGEKTVTTQSDGTLGSLAFGMTLGQIRTGGHPLGYELLGFAMSASATTTDVGSDTVFTEDTRIYAVWKAPASPVTSYIFKGVSFELTGLNQLTSGSDAGRWMPAFPIDWTKFLVSIDPGADSAIPDSTLVEAHFDFLYTDAACTTILTGDMQDTGTYYLRLVVNNKNAEDHSIDYSSLVSEHCSATVAGYTTSFVSAAETAFAGKDAVEVVFSVTRNSTPVTTYPVWVGGVQVTDANKDDILGDGGKAKYDPDSKTLTLDNPTVSGAYSNAAVYAEVDLTIKGSATLSKIILVKEKDLTLDANIEISTPGRDSAIVAGNITVNGGSINASADEDALFATSSITINAGSVVGNGCDLYAESITIANGTVNVSGLDGIYSKNDITISGGTVTAKGDEDGINAGGSVTISGGTITATGGNYGITAKYAVSVSAGTVTAAATMTDSNYYSALHGESVTITGGTVSAKTASGKAIYAYSGNVEISADVTAVSEAGSAVEAWYGDIVLSGGTIIAQGTTRALDADNYTRINNGITKVTLDGDPAVYEAGSDSVLIGDALIIEEPEGGTLDNDKTTILESDGTTKAKHVVIVPGTVVTTYPVWVGGVQVTDANKDDILGDGTASFDPSTNTLTLDGLNVGDGYHASGASIVSTGIDLTVKGSATLSGAGYGIYVIETESGGGNLTLDGATITYAVASGSDTGIRADGNISISGDGTIDVTAAKNGIYAGGSVTISGGEVTATGSECGISAAHGDVTISGGTVTAKSDTVGIEATNGTIKIQNGTTSVTANGAGAAIGAGGITIGDEMMIKEPAGGFVGDITGSRVIKNSDDTTATHAVIVPGTVTPLPKVIGVKANVTGTQANAGGYDVQTDALETLFESSTAPVTMSTSFLYTDKACQIEDKLTTTPAAGTPYYFVISINAYTDGDPATLEWADNATIKSGSTLTADNGTVEIVEFFHSPAGGSLSVICKYTETPVTHTVTYKVVNGTWSDGTTADKTETVASSASPASVPTGMIASSGYTGGAWDTDPATAAIEADTAFTYTFTAAPPTTIQVPTFEKKVKDPKDTSAETGGWQDSAEYGIGDVVPYKLTATLASNVTDYLEYHITFTDEMENSLTFKEITGVTVNGTPTSSYTLILESPRKFTLKLTWGDGVAKIADTSLNSAEVVVTFKATLNENANLGSEGNVNAAELTYSCNPNVDSSGNPSADTACTGWDYVIVFTYETPATHTVTFNSNGGSAVPAQTVNDGEKATKPADPSKSGFVFDGWYADATFSVAFDFSAPITADVTVYAKWKEEAAPGEIVYTIVSGGNSTWTKGSSSGVTIVVKRDPNDEECFSHFASVQIGSTTLASGTDYTAVAGSTVITLNASALQKLTTGTKTVTINFDDGKATTSLIIKAGSSGTSGGTSPKTGDNSHMGLWITMMILSMAGLGCMALIGRKRRYAPKH